MQNQIAGSSPKAHLACIGSDGMQAACGATAADDPNGEAYTDPDLVTCQACRATPVFGRVEAFFKKGEGK